MLLKMLLYHWTEPLGRQLWVVTDASSKFPPKNSHATEGPLAPAVLAD